MFQDMRRPGCDLRRGLARVRRGGAGPGSRSASAPQTKQALLDAARDVFAEHAFTQVKAVEIAARAAMTVGVIYYQFGGGGKPYSRRDGSAWPMSPPPGPRPGRSRALPHVGGGDRGGSARHQDAQGSGRLVLRGHRGDAPRSRPTRLHVTVPIPGELYATILFAVVSEGARAFAARSLTEAESALRIGTPRRPGRKPRAGPAPSMAQCRPRA
jgi:hypothetical protein